MFADSFFYRRTYIVLLEIIAQSQNKNPYPVSLVWCSPFCCLFFHHGIETSLNHTDPHYKNPTPMETKNRLRIENPCPFAPTRMNKDGENFFCKSCSKTITDFRGKTADEIKCSINATTCGIFTADQLPGQQKMTFLRQTLFYGLTLLSFLGFSVKPVSAQTTQPPKAPASVNTKTNKEDSLRATKVIYPKVDKKKQPVTRKKSRVIGCPEF